MGSYKVFSFLNEAILSVNLSDFVSSPVKWKLIMSSPQGFYEDKIRYLQEIAWQIIKCLINIGDNHPKL